MKTTQKILMPIDFSSVAQNAVRHANSIAAAQAAEVVLVYIHKPDSQQEEQAIQENFKTFEALELKNASFLYRFEVLQGELLNQLVNATEQHQADVVIMGLKDRVSDLSLAGELIKLRQKSQTL